MPPFTYKETTRIALEQKLLQPKTQMQNINLAIPDKHTQGSLNQSEEIHAKKSVSKLYPRKTDEGATQFITVKNLCYISYISDWPKIKANKLLKVKEIKCKFSYTNSLSILCFRRI